MGGWGKTDRGGDAVSRPTHSDDDRPGLVAPDAEPMARASDAAVAERYRLLLELSPDAIAVHQDGLIVYVNSAALAFARVDDREAMLGRSIAEFVHPDELPQMIERIIGMGDEAGASTTPEEVVMVDAHGVSRPMEVTSVRTSGTISRPIRSSSETSPPRRRSSPRCADKQRCSTT